jgi:hypothetical protein
VSNCVDKDDDGYYTGGISCGIIDCDDSNADVNPAATETCNDIHNCAWFIGIYVYL